jgi:hypothetical protein
VRKSSQIEATTATTKTKNENEKMNAQPTARIVDIEDNSRLKVVLTTPLRGMMQVFRAHGYKCTGANRNPYNRAELQGLPMFSGLIGPMWDGDGSVLYETTAAYNDISADIS